MLAPGHQRGRREPRLLSEGGGGERGLQAERGGALPISPLFSGGPSSYSRGSSPGPVGQLLFGMQGWRALAWGSGVEVEGVFWRRLCCFAMLIWGGGGREGITTSNNPAALFACLSLFLLPPSHPPWCHL